MQFEWGSPTFLAPVTYCTRNYEYDLFNTNAQRRRALRHLAVTHDSESGAPRNAWSGVNGALCA
jgi:hypothetical protein